MSATRDLVEIRITVRGAVQGVGYRWFARETAIRLGVTGWVRNLPDGSVELEARGPQAAIDALLATLHEGPPKASVREVRTVPRLSSDELHGRFTILR